ncbi:hypothetical protein BH09ACT4_BH09ACT4_05360 [soil metagenome]
MPNLPPVLDSSHLPLAERMAARLDGELYQLGNGHCPIDEPETPQLRLAAALAGRPTRFIAELGTAAWVWGALPLQPARLELCVDLRARARPQQARHASVREVALTASDLAVLGVRRVTIPLRTAVDLARAREPFEASDADAVRQLAELGRFGIEECRSLMDRGRNLPAKVRALGRLRDALCS